MMVRVWSPELRAQVLWSTDSCRDKERDPLVYHEVPFWKIIGGWVVKCLEYQKLRIHINKAFSQSVLRKRGY